MRPRRTAPVGALDLDRLVQPHIDAAAQEEQRPLGAVGDFFSDQSGVHSPVHIRWGCHIGTVGPLEAPQGRGQVPFQAAKRSQSPSGISSPMRIRPRKMGSAAMRLGRYAGSPAAPRPPR